MFGHSVQTEVFTRSDLANTLRAAEMAFKSALVVAEPDALTMAYETGYRSALATVALAFGLIPAGGGAEGREWRLLR